MQTDDVEYECSECGTTVSADDKFCKKCGASLAETVTESSPSTPNTLPQSNQSADWAKRIEYRIDALEMRLPNSNIIHQSFWKRAWTVFGYSLATTAVIYGIILGVVFIFYILTSILK